MHTRTAENTRANSRRGMRARARAQSRFSGGREGRGGFASCRFAGTLHVVVGIRALDWRRPASREGRDASQERTLILNRGPSCSERQFNERVFRGRITVVHPSGPLLPREPIPSAADLVSAGGRDRLAASHVITSLYACEIPRVRLYFPSPSSAIGGGQG